MDQPPSTPPTPPDPQADDEQEQFIDLEPERVRICEECGATMSGQADAICIRCGFDHHRKTKHETEQAAGDEEQEAPEVDDDSDTSEDSADVLPLSPKGRGGVIVVEIIAAAVMLLLLIGYLTGSEALVAIARDEDGIKLHEAVPFLDRFFGLCRSVLLIAMLWCCAAGGLFLASLFTQRPIGLFRLAGLRLLAAVTVMRLASFVDVSSASMEWTLEVPLQAVLFVGMTMAFFKVTLREAIGVALGTAGLLILLWLGAHVIILATGV